MDFKDFVENTEKSFSSRKQIIFFVMEVIVDVISKGCSEINYTEKCRQ